MAVTARWYKAWQRGVRHFTCDALGRAIHKKTGAEGALE